MFTEARAVVRRHLHVLAEARVPDHGEGDEDEPDSEDVEVARQSACEASCPSDAAMMSAGTMATQRVMSRR